MDKANLIFVVLVTTPAGGILSEIQSVFYFNPCMQEN